MQDLVAGRVSSCEEIAISEGKVERHIQYLAPLVYLSPRIVEAAAKLLGVHPLDPTDIRRQERLDPLPLFVGLREGAFQHIKKVAERNRKCRRRVLRATIPTHKLKRVNMESLLKLIFAAAIIITISSSVALAGRCHRTSGGGWHHGWHHGWHWHHSVAWSGYPEFRESCLNGYNWTSCEYPLAYQ